MILTEQVRRMQVIAGIIKENEDPAIDVPSTEQPSTEPVTNEQTVTREQAVNLIRGTKGKFFTVTFTKKDGTTRVMNARLDVKKHLKGGELKYNPNDFGYIPVYDMQAAGYRMVNSNTITSFVIGRNKYNVQ